LPAFVFVGNAIASSALMTASTLTRPVSSTKADHQSLGQTVVSTFEWFGESGRFSAAFFRALLTPPFEFREFLRQCDETGAKTLPVVALAGVATGVVISLQTVPLKEHATLEGNSPVEISDLVSKASGILDTVNGAVQNVGLDHFEGQRRQRHGWRSSQ
jgi:hypothetical protein